MPQDRDTSRSAPIGRNTRVTAGAERRHLLTSVVVTFVLVVALVAPIVARRGASAASVPSVGGLSVFVGYAEDKEINTPNPRTFPVPWAGAPNTVFLGNTVPGQAACGTLTVCYDTGAIRLDNPTSGPITVTNVSVDMHSSVAGGKVFNNLWGVFTVPPGQSVILAANPPATNPGFDNFDTSGFPNNNCTPVPVPPTVTITINGVASTLADSSHVLDTGGIDAGFCPPKQNESIQWRPIGAAGTNSATISLGPATVSAFAGTPVTETATVLDGGGTGLPNVDVNFNVTSGPDAGLSGTAISDSTGQAAFTFTGVGEGEDAVVASVTTVGTFQTNVSRVMVNDNSTTGWTSSDIGTPTPAGTDSLDSTTGTWTLQGGGGGIGGTSDKFHFVSKPSSSTGGIAARITSQTNTSTGAKTGVMLRADTSPGAAFYAAFVTPAGGITIEDRTTNGAASVITTSTSGAPPARLWIRNTGGTLVAYRSSDGYTWAPIPGSTVALNLAASPLAGLADTSNNAAQLSTAVIDAVVVTGTAPAPVPPISCPAPWNCADIGNPTPAGSESYDPGTGTWTLNAGGSDITGPSDQFRFVSQSLTGDGSVIARVATQTNTNSSAKAGVMLRASTDPAAPNYAVLASPGTGVKVQERATTGGTTVKLANPAGTTPVYLKVSRVGNTFTAYTSPDRTTWTLIPGSTFTITLGTTLLEGLAVTSHNSGALGTVTMDNVSPPVDLTNTTTTTSTSSMSSSTSSSTSTSTSTSTSSSTTTSSTTLPVGACPSLWTCGDIGNPAPAGSQSFDPNTRTWTLNASGADITGASDEFRFASRTLTGDGSISARVATQTSTSSNAKAGVMLRASTDPAAPNYAVLVSPGVGIKVQERATLGGTTAKLANPAGTTPAYLKVSRVGNTFTAYTSPDGITWTLIAGSTFTMTLGSTLLEGLGVTSHHAGVLSTVTMDTVTAT
jgi:hypothetical protein